MDSILANHDRSFVKSAAVDIHTGSIFKTAKTARGEVYIFLDKEREMEKLHPLFLSCSIFVIIHKNMLLKSYYGTKRTVQTVNH